MQINLQNIDQATEQEIFNQVVEHARTQRTRCTDGGGVSTENCLYRDGHGLKCFAGALMTDDEVAFMGKEYNGKPFIDVQGFFSFQYREIINSLQDIHDLHSVADWDREFTVLANDYNLEYTPQLITKVIA